MKQTFYERIGESVYREVLPNGLQVCVVPKPEHAKKYAFFATRYGGMDTRFCLDGKWLDTPAGIAHYLEHKMFDTKEGNALQELAKNGAEPNAFTSNAMTGYYFDSTEHFEENLEILLSFVSIPYFTEESVAKEQGIIGQEIRMIEDNPDWQLYTRMMQALYQKSTARTSIAGTVESISHITAETLYDCHKAFYTPSNMILTVVGNVDPVHVADLARRILPREGGPVIPRDYGQEPAQVAAKETRMAMEVSAPQFLTAYKCAPAADGEDYLRTAVLGDMACDILLGDSSPLYQRLYEEGVINTSFGGAFEMMPGVAYLYAGGDSKDARRAAAEIQREAERLAAEGIDEDYYQRVRRASFGSNLRGLNSFENIAVTLTEGYFHGYDPYRRPYRPWDLLVRHHFGHRPAGGPGAVHEAGQALRPDRGQCAGYGAVGGAQLHHRRPPLLCDLLSGPLPQRRWQLKLGRDGGGLGRRPSHLRRGDCRGHRGIFLHPAQEDQDGRHDGPGGDGPAAGPVHRPLGQLHQSGGLRRRDYVALADAPMDQRHGVYRGPSHVFL